MTGELPAGGPGNSAGAPISVFEDDIVLAASIEADELDVWFARHRRVIVAGYLLVLSLFLLFLSAFGVFFSSEIPHIAIEALTGDTDLISAIAAHALSVNDFGNATITIVYILAYLSLQGLLLSGIGKVYLRSRPRRGYYWLSVAVISAVGTLLAGGGACLIGVLDQTVANRYGDTPHWLNASFLWLLLAGWLFWLALAMIYRRGDGEGRALPRLIRVLLAASWIEFSLALPIDLAARNRETCLCAVGSWLTLLLALPVLIWSIGPALYLLYLRERELSLAQPGRARAILRQKSRRYSRSSRKVESHVSAARTISLAVIVLGFIGLQLGLYNYQRGTLFAQARTLIVARTVSAQVRSDQALKLPRNKDDKLTLPETPLGRIVVTADVDTDQSLAFWGYKLRISHPEPLSATVTPRAPPLEEWRSRPFSSDLEADEEHLRQVLAALSIELRGNGADIAPAQLIEMVRDKIYTRRVKLPSVDFGDFGTNTAAWIVSFLCAATLVALRSVVRRIFRGSDAGIDEAWLVLDGRAVGENLVAGIWIAAIGSSAWLATFGLILTAMDDFQTASPRPGGAAVTLAYAAFAALMGLSTWAGLGTVADLLRLRALRQTVDENSAV